MCLFRSSFKPDAGTSPRGGCPYCHNVHVSLSLSSVIAIRDSEYQEALRHHSQRHCTGAAPHYLKALARTHFWENSECLDGSMQGKIVHIIFERWTTYILRRTCPLQISQRCKWKWNILNLINRNLHPLSNKYIEHVLFCPQKVQWAMKCWDIHRLQFSYSSRILILETP